MKIFSVNQIGQFHTQHNEDAIKIAKIGSNQTLVSVFDGCSSGIESHFASSLLSKIVDKVAHDLYYKEFATGDVISNSVLLDIVIKSIFELVNKYKADLNLKELELLTTIVIPFLFLDDGIGSRIFQSRSRQKT